MKEAKSADMDCQESLKYVDSGAMGGPAARVTVVRDVIPTPGKRQSRPVGAALGVAFGSGGVQQPAS